MNLKIRIEACLKRILDIVSCFLLFIIFLPLFFIIALLIKIDSKGPVFFLQKRCGRNGKVFNMYKFRTMVEDAESLKKRLTNEMDGAVLTNCLRY